MTDKRTYKGNTDFTTMTEADKAQFLDTFSVHNGGGKVELPWNLEEKVDKFIGSGAICLGAYPYDCRLESLEARWIPGAYDCEHEGDEYSDWYFAYLRDFPNSVTLDDLCQNLYGMNYKDAIRAAVEKDGGTMDEKGNVPYPSREA